jgi:hypothetical protein
MLICGENTNPLSRYALMAEGEQVHISTYPPFWPTRPPEENGGYDLRRAIEIRAGAHAFEAKVFNIASSGFADQDMIDSIAKTDPDIRSIMEESPKSVSMVLDPTGAVISDVISDDEGIAYAQINTADAIEPKQFHDVVGYYNRFDIFNLTVDRAHANPRRLTMARFNRSSGPTPPKSLTRRTCLPASKRTDPSDRPRPPWANPIRSIGLTGYDEFRLVLCVCPIMKRQFVFVAPRTCQLPLGVLQASAWQAG